ncbi:hypothetical protein Nepgr_033288 [Nepenthes gracilis]|uniref:Uncharacterized protein n=1 Tax=Nepenthes gracilis TaxID=150966 RepID=A0AAD3TK80_NEPGR|nr:hypothetical protein Nepgr_033288 [Nepenthes gracilis]
MAFQYTDQEYYKSSEMNTMTSPGMGLSHHHHHHHHPAEVVREKVEVVEYDQFAGRGRENSEVVTERVEAVGDGGCFREKREDFEAHKYQSY